MDDFARTRRGAKFFDIDVPRIAAALEKIAERLAPVVCRWCPEPAAYISKATDGNHYPSCTTHKSAGATALRSET